jgi:hypothetical protein
MKVPELWRQYDFYTGETTKHARYLGFAGLGLCWFFRTSDITFPTAILTAMVILVLFFLTDLLQYYVGAMNLRGWLQREEKQAGDNGIELGMLDLWPPKELDRQGFWLFKAKLVLLLIGFLSIGVELVTRIVSA